jgi:nitrite reductase/ring-hydroxylating ferredoxin subunit
MQSEPEGVWVELGPVEELAKHELQAVMAGRTRLALSYRDGRFSAISGVCNHAGGPLGEGKLDGDYVVCPWHYWKYHRQTGLGEPGFEDDGVPSYALKT